MNKERLKCECGNLVEKIGTLKNGNLSWGKICRSCRGRYRYGILKGKECSECGFVAKVSPQLEIDHINGDRTNNDHSNLRTVCCNCHALKSHENGDFRFIGKDNPIFNKKHNEETLSKIRIARHKQDIRRKDALRKIKN